MLKNYLLTAFRSFRRHKFFSSLNIIGLSIGFACAVMISLFLWEEISYDSFHEKGDRIVRLNMEYKFGEDSERTVVTGTKVGPAFKRDFPEVEEFVRFQKYQLSVSYEDKTFEERNFLFADSTLFDVFNFQMTEGNPEQALIAGQKVVITESTAKKYFGNERPIGKTIKTNGNREFEVTGIVKDAPSNSQIKFDFIASFASLQESNSENWWTANYTTYLLLHENVDLEALQAKIRPYMDAHSDEHEAKDGNYLTYHLEPFKDVHLYSAYTGLEPNMDIRYIYIFGFVAILIVIIASINYMNLATAKASERAREVGLRKVLGAEKSQLFKQFMGEAFFISIFAAILSLVFIQFSIPLFNSLTGSTLFDNDSVYINVLIIITILVLTSTLLAGSYPAIILSKFAPHKTLKGSFKSSDSGIFLRKTLIVFQFMISILLLISTLVISNQMEYIRSKNLGFQKEHVIVQKINNTIASKFESIKSQLKQLPEIEEVTMAYDPPHKIGWGDNILVEGIEKEKMITANPVEKDFLKTFRINLIAGRDFNEQDQTFALSKENIETRETSFILNETAVRELGLTPESAIGKRVLDGRPGTIIGVVEDFHFNSLHQKIGPLMLFSENMYREMYIRVKGNNLAETISYLENVWQTSGTERPFNYSFLDDSYNNMYKNEQKLGQLFTLFSTLTIILGCLGLLGLSAFSISQRTKEISIRKVLGASSLNLITLLSKDFIKLVLISFMIAAPIAYYAMNQWLQNFNYQQGLSLNVFLLSGGLVLILTLITLSTQTIAAVGKNPAEVMKHD